MNFNWLVLYSDGAEFFFSVSKINDNNNNNINNNNINNNNSNNKNNSKV